MQIKSSFAGPVHRLVMEFSPTSGRPNMYHYQLHVRSMWWAQLQDRIQFPPMHWKLAMKCENYDRLSQNILTRSSRTVPRCIKVLVLATIAIFVFISAGQWVWMWRLSCARSRTMPRCSSQAQHKRRDWSWDASLSSSEVSNSWISRPLYLNCLCMVHENAVVQQLGNLPMGVPVHVDGYLGLGTQRHQIPLGLVLRSIEIRRPNLTKHCPQIFQDFQTTHKQCSKPVWVWKSLLKDDCGGCRFADRLESPGKGRPTHNSSKFLPKRAFGLRISCGCRNESNERSLVKCTWSQARGERSRLGLKADLRELSGAGCFTASLSEGRKCGWRRVGSSWEQLLQIISRTKQPVGKNNVSPPTIRAEILTPDACENQCN